MKNLIIKQKELLIFEILYKEVIRPDDVVRK